MISNSPEKSGIAGRGAALAWLVVLLMMGLIFLLSAQPADQSVRLSGGLTKILLAAVAWLFPGLAQEPEIIHHLIRKSAHFLAYLVLGALTANACRRSGVRPSRTWLLALLICVLYAVSDETHQMFVSGRGPAMSDVLIDSAGAGLGIWLRVVRGTGLLTTPSDDKGNGE